MAPEPPEGREEKVRALDEDDIALLKTYGQGPYSARIKDIEKDVKDTVKKVNDVSGIKESDTGLAAPSRWDLVSDKQAMQEEQPLQVSIPLERVAAPTFPCALAVVELRKMYCNVQVCAYGSLCPSPSGHNSKVWTIFLNSMKSPSAKALVSRWPGARRLSSLALRRPSM